MPPGVLLRHYRWGSGMPLRVAAWRLVKQYGPQEYAERYHCRHAYASCWLTLLASLLTSLLRFTSLRHTSLHLPTLLLVATYHATIRAAGYVSIRY